MHAALRELHVELGGVLPDDIHEDSPWHQVALLVGQMTNMPVSFSMASSFMPAVMRSVTHHAKLKKVSFGGVMENNDVLQQLRRAVNLLLRRHGRQVSFDVSVQQ